MATGSVAVAVATQLFYRSGDRDHDTGLLVIINRHVEYVRIWVVLDFIVVGGVEHHDFDRSKRTRLNISERELEARVIAARLDVLRAVFRLRLPRRDVRKITAQAAHVRTVVTVIVHAFNLVHAERESESPVISDLQVSPIPHDALPSLPL